MGCGAASAACCNLIICFPIKIFYFSVLRTEEQLQMHTRIFKEEQRAGNQQLVFAKMQITVLVLYLLKSQKVHICSIYYLDSLCLIFRAKKYKLFKPKKKYVMSKDSNIAEHVF